VPEIVGFVSAGRRIAATICAPDRVVGEPGAGVVFVHGRNSHRRDFAAYGEQVARELGVTCLALDLSGHGESSGTRGDISPDQHLLDVLAAWDELAARPGVAAGRIALCGTSYGACLAAHAVRQRSVARLLLHAPTIVVDEDMARPLRLRSPQRDPAAAHELFDGLASYRRPALVVESEHDEWIRPVVIDAYLTALPGAQHEVIADATHALSRPEWRQVFAGLLLEFLAGL
jgi:uncharacterized protein